MPRHRRSELAAEVARIPRVGLHRLGEITDRLPGLVALADSWPIRSQVDTGDPVVTLIRELQAVLVELTVPRVGEHFAERAERERRDELLIVLFRLDPRYPQTLDARRNLLADRYFGGKVDALRQSVEPKLYEEIAGRLVARHSDTDIDAPRQPARLLETLRAERRRWIAFWLTPAIVLLDVDPAVEVSRSEFSRLELRLARNRGRAQDLLVEVIWRSNLPQPHAATARERWGVTYEGLALDAGEQERTAAMAQLGIPPWPESLSNRDRLAVQSRVGAGPKPSFDYFMKSPPAKRVYGAYYEWFATCACRYDVSWECPVHRSLQRAGIFLVITDPRSSPEQIDDACLLWESPEADVDNRIGLSVLRPASWPPT